MAVERVIDRRAFGAGFVTVLCVLVCLTVTVTVPTVSAAPGLCAGPGADGPQPTLGGTVNTYFPGISTAVAAGATSLDLGAGIGATTPIAAGDKLLIIQMQAADLNTTNTDAYGDGITGEPPSGATNWGSAGTYELAVAANSVSTVGGTLQLSAGTQNAYATAAATATAGRQAFQVVRVPQFSSATLGSNVTAAPWNGSAGGIVALDVAGTLDLNGFRIDVSASGFRGGAGAQLGGGAGGASTDARTSAANAFNGGKAEGVAGTPRYVFDGTSTIDTGVEGYPNGSFARGAPANAGGGGNDGNPSANDQNSGGGGGANGGGGGHGGNSWFSNLAIGGAGGVAVPAASATHVVLGGGGGGATRNNAGPSSGGVGGGLVILDVGSLTGTGEIRANGSDGQTAANDGGGGGGAGGSVVVLTGSGGLPGLTVSANGGDGGDAWPTQAPGGFPGERHGPGGGGGGGFILLSTSGATTSTNGGAHGVTTTASDAYNATDGAGGSAGTFVGSLPGAGGASSCSPQLTVTKTTATPNVTNTPSGTSATYTIAVANSAGRDVAEQTALSDALPAGLTFASSGLVILGGGATRALVVNPSAGATSPSWGEFTIPGGGSVSVTFSVDIASSVGASILQNPATATYLDPARTTVGGTTTTSYDPISSAGEDVRVRWPDMTIAKSHSGAFSRGGSHAYALTATNSGDATSSGSVTVTDVLPTGLTPTVAAGTGWTCGIVTQAVTCMRSDGLAGGASYPTVTVTATVAQSAASSITNTATVVGGNEQVTSNNSASDPTAIVDTADPRIGISPALISGLVGSNAAFTVDVRNNGPSPAQNVQAVITVPSGFSVGSAIGTGWSCSIALSVITCDLAGPLGPSASAPSITLQTTLPLAAGGYSVSAAVTSSTLDTNSTNNTATAAVTVNAAGTVNPPQPPAAPRADLSLTKTTSSAVVAHGARISYALAVHNDGPDAAVDVVITDTLPAGLTFISAAGAGWACTSAGAVITCTRPQLAAGATTAVTLVVIAARVGTVRNNANVTSSTGDPNATNGVEAAAVSVIARVPRGIVPTRLGVTIKPGFATVASGEPTRFVVRTTNTGKSVAKGVVTCVTIPAGANIARASGGLLANGSYCWRQASLKADASVDYVISIRADRRQAQRFALVARAVARNARATNAKARVSVLAAIEKTTGGYTG